LSALSLLITKIASKIERVKDVKKYAKIPMAFAGAAKGIFGGSTGIIYNLLQLFISLYSVVQIIYCSYSYKVVLLFIDILLLFFRFPPCNVEELSTQVGKAISESQDPFCQCDELLKVMDDIDTAMKKKDEIANANLKGESFSDERFDVGSGERGESVFSPEFVDEVLFI